MRVNEREDNVTVDEFEVADPAEAWVQAGFSVDSDAICRVGGVRIRLAGRGPGTGIVGWSLRGVASNGYRSRMRCNPDAGSRRCDITSSGSRFRPR
jgi:hypothetical protein